VDDKARYYTRILNSNWEQHLADIVANRYKLRYYGFDPNDLKSMIAELQTGAERLGVMQSIEDALRAQGAYTNVNQEAMIWMQARTSSAMLSEFINFLGFSPVRKPDPKDRTIVISNKNYLLFEPSKIPGDYPELPDLPPPYEKPYHRDWRLALFQLMNDNVYSGVKKYDIPQNNRLGAVLESADKNNKILLGEEAGEPQAKEAAR
jgi:hypothetical protein